MKNKIGPILFCILLVVSILLLYTAYDKKEKSIVLENLVDVLSFKDLPQTLSEFNKVAALAGIGLVSISMSIGPLALIFPRNFGRYMRSRKFLGLTGFAFILIHSFYAIFLKYEFSITEMFIENDKSLGVILALIAFVIFLAMAITSNAASIKRFGAKRWKTLHRFGYLALALVTLHFIIMETKAGRLDVRPYGKLFLILPIITLILKLISVIYKKIDRERGE
ncbi:MAG: ferric reductase-like transmembrane domain-containing protein [Candidatus Ratteibacteria bacterium]|nr:ferric reductase-like transmembrane domain-containing protein [Candidatus Ratteibacteria bacterium]